MPEQTKQERKEAIWEQIAYYSGHKRLVRREGSKAEAAGKHDIETFERVQKAIMELGDALNSGGRKPAVYGALDGLMRTHRYLQNGAVWMLLEALGRLPESERPDARNESAHAACQRVRETLSEQIYWEGL